jgi:hypothetical protein
MIKIFVEKYEDSYIFSKHPHTSKEFDRSFLFESRVICLEFDQRSPRYRQMESISVKWHIPSVGMLQAVTDIIGL